MLFWDLCKWYLCKWFAYCLHLPAYFVHFSAYFAHTVLCWSLCNGIFYVFFTIQLYNEGIFFSYLLIFFHIFCRCLHIWCIYLHFAYFSIYCAYLCIFWAYNCIYMHIPILQVPCTGQLRPFLFHSCSTWQQATLLPVNTLILTVTCHVNLAPTLAPGWAGSWLCQNTWFIKLRKPSGLPSASPSWVESAVCLTLSWEVKVEKIWDMPRLLGKIMKINFLTCEVANLAGQQLIDLSHSLV